MGHAQGSGLHLGLLGGGAGQFSGVACKHVFHFVQAQVALQDNVLESGSAALDAVLHHGDAASLQTVCQALARRAGPIVNVTSLLPGATDVPLERLLIERALSVNTAAAGGNASLMTIG